MGKTVFALSAFVLFAIIVFGLFWFFAIGSAAPVGFGWYVFSFVAGITMIVLPCTLPLAFVIVPLSLGKTPAKGIGIALAFSAGIVITLSFYGVIAALVGEVAIGTINAPLETIKNWLYVVAGLFAYLFALGGIELIRFRMPSYTGAAPAFIQQRGDYLKAFLLGLFLGNIGVGCPHPATPVILTRIAASGDIFYGWLLFLVHAIGRVLPLLLLTLLGLLGVNALQWIVARKDRIERAAGWSMVFVGAFIFVLGLFTHDWWVASGQHTLWEELTREEQVVGVIAHRLGIAEPLHPHGLEEIAGKTGLSGLPLWMGNWVLVLLWVIPLWWYYFKKRINRDHNSAASLILLTVLLLITFVYYLPLRFERQAALHEAMERKMDMMHGEEHEAPYHEALDVQEGLTVFLGFYPPQPVFTGTTTQLEFFVNEQPGAIPITDLEIEHDKLMHVIGVRNDMEEFFHIHPVSELGFAGNPVFAGKEVPIGESRSFSMQEIRSGLGQSGIFTKTFVFTKPGLYKIWSEIKKDGINHVFGHPEIAVEGEGEKYNKRVGFGRNVISGDYQVALRLDESAPAGQEVDLLFDVHTLDSFKVELDDYLAAKMHLTIIKDDWKQFIHTHPVGEIDHHGKSQFIQEARANGGGHDSAEAGHGVNFRVAFPEPGLYKAFAQFRPAGIGLPSDEALVAGFWIRVEESAPQRFSPVSLSRNTLVGISLILIFVLSWGMKRCLEA